jgi:hypothetical protein
MLKISSKLPDVGVTIFSVMTALVNEHKAINLSRGQILFCQKDDTLKKGG